MPHLSIDQTIPDLEVLITGDKRVRLSEFRGQKLILYFYPRANTPGCTQEGKEFSAVIDRLRSADTAILGASRDGIKAQTNFKDKQGFAFDLIADKDEVLCRTFDVIKLKKMYGKESYGVERSTFLIDAEGILRKEWRGVKVKGHVDQVLKALTEL